MVMCWAPTCKHYNQRETCKFYRFPKNEHLRNKWKKLVRREIEPGPGAFICSCHFKDGNKENCPTIFHYNHEEMHSFTSPENTPAAHEKKRYQKVFDDNIIETTNTSQPMEKTEADGIIIPISSGETKFHILYRKLDRLSRENERLKNKIEEYENSLETLNQRYLKLEKTIKKSENQL